MGFLSNYITCDYNGSGWGWSGNSGRDSEGWDCVGGNSGLDDLGGVSSNNVLHIVVYGLGHWNVGGVSEGWRWSHRDRGGGEHWSRACRKGVVDSSGCCQAGSGQKWQQDL